MSARERLKYARQEDEANVFACFLLMPSPAWEQQVEKLREEVKDEDQVIIGLTKVFKVPLFAVVMRLQLAAMSDRTLLNTTEY